MSAKRKPAQADAPVVERWDTDGHRVWRAPGGPTVCLLGDPHQAQLFQDADAHQLRDALLIARAPQLRAALADCARRLESCCHHSGTAAEYAHLAVQGYRDLIAETHGEHPHAKGHP